MRTNLDKAKVQSLGLSLGNVVQVLQTVLAHNPIQKIEGADLILAVGNTGSGKSTLFTSRAFGIDALEEVLHEEKVYMKQADGSTKERVKKKKVLTQRHPEKINGVFKIGHSSNESMTFMPHFASSLDGGAVFVDIAGL